MAYISRRKRLYLSVFIVIAIFAAAIALFVIFVMPKKATISFNDNLAEEIVIEKGEVMPTLPIPSKYGHEFEGWYYSEIFNESTRVKVGIDEVNNDVKLYAHFIKGTYTVTFDANGGQGNAIAPITKQFEEGFYLPTETTAGIYMQDKALKCWAFNKEGTGQTFKPGVLQSMFGEDTTLYAIWDYPLTTIQYVTGSGAEYIPPKEFYTGQLVPEEGQAPPPVREGYSFDGWYFDEDFSDKIDFTQYKLPAGEVRFYAKWTPHQFTATFYVDGVIDPKLTQTIYYDGVVTKPSKDPEKIGKVFVSWCVDESLLSNYIFGTKVKGNVTLYAKFGDIPPVEDETPASAFKYVTNPDGNTITITGMQDDSKNVNKIIFPRQIDGKNVVAITEVNNLENLIEVSLPYTIQTISNTTFINCPNLKEYKMISKSQYFEVKNGVLYSANFETLYRYPASKEGNSYTTNSKTVTIESGAFNRTQILQNLTVDAANINANAFLDCASVANLTLTSKITTIAETAFLGCGSLQNVISQSPQITVEDGAIYNFNKTRLIKYFDKTPNANFVAPSTLVSADVYAFQGATNLESVTFDVNFNDIGGYAFSDCTNLKHLTFKASTFTSVGTLILSGCTSVQSITLNKSDTNILYVKILQDHKEFEDLIVGL